jgi:repressor LexA
VAERAPTDRQARILEVIRTFTEERGYPPSVREIGERVGLSSPSTVQAHLKTLERRGLILRDPTKPRALVSTSQQAELAEARAESRAGARAGAERAEPEYGVLPIVGKVAAGVPITAVENLEGEFILPASFARRPDTFILRVKGDSMIEAAILDGDLIVVSPQPNAENGEIVVALVDGEATVKRFYREAGRIRLQPENRTMEPIFSNTATIVGRVEAVVRKL